MQAGQHEMVVDFCQQEHLVSSTKTARCSWGIPFHLDTGRPSYACPSFLNFWTCQMGVAQV